MDLGLRTKRALVTGSTAGIGFAIADRLAREGATVILNGRSRERVAAAVARLRADVPDASVVGVAADVGTEAGARQLIAAEPEIDVLVNNAGVFTPRSIAEWTTEDWTSMYATNVLSGVWLSQHHLQRMLVKDAGRILFISSESAVQIPAEMIHYGVSKAAQSAFARGLAELTKGTNVTVNSVLVGPTWSEGVGTFVGELAAREGKTDAEMQREFFATARPTSLVQRFARVEEIANVVAFLASGSASIVSGAAVRADGGLLKSVF